MKFIQNVRRPFLLAQVKETLLQNQLLAQILRNVLRISFLSRMSDKRGTQN